MGVCIMTLLWLLIGFAIGAVFGAKHQAITLFFYTKYKPTLDRWKKWATSMVGKWFKKQ